MTTFKIKDPLWNEFQDYCDRAAKPVQWKTWVKHVIRTQRVLWKLEMDYLFIKSGDLRVTPAMYSDLQVKIDKARKELAKYRINACTCTQI